MLKPNPKILFISTNSMWSGSEELWSRSARYFLKQGFDVAITYPYDSPNLSDMANCRICINEFTPSLSFLGRAIRKIKVISSKESPLPIILLLQKVNPRLVVISQGNNIGSVNVMQACSQLNISYVTLTQLVTEVHYLSIGPHNLMALQSGYLKAKKNFFVSTNNLHLNNWMTGLQLTNAEVVFNPCKIAEADIPEFPIGNSVFQIGLVGRIEFFHKGYDLLLQVCSQQKWKERPVQFNIYGDGPHRELLKVNLEALAIRNISFKGHKTSISEIWGENQLLCLPSRMEGQALALIEAMFCKRAAVVTNVGGAEELINDGYNGFIAEAATVEALDKALERAWNFRNNWKKMGENAAITLQQKYPKDAIAHFSNKIKGLLM